MKLIKAFALGLVLSLTSCATVTRVGLSGVGALIGSLGGPPGIVAGAGIGVASADLLLQEDEISEQADTIQEQAEVIQSLTRGDVEGILASKEQTWAGGVIAEVMGVLKLLGLLAAIVVAGIGVWIVRRKKYASKYYEVIDKWLKEEENEQKK